jgi:hypothetical protein
MITIQYIIEEKRPNYYLNKTWTSVPVADIVGFDDDDDLKSKVKIIQILF